VEGVRVNENKSKARLRVVSEKGHIYAAESADGTRIKIGFSTQLADRLKAINFDFPGSGPFKLLGSTVSTFRVEQQLHRAMRPFHQIHVNAGKELYPAAPAVLTVVEAVIAQPTLDVFPIDDLLAFRRWCRHQATLDENKAIARIVYADRIAEMEDARRRWMERIIARIEARNAAKVAA
jgi:hypothetical protein